MTLKEFNTFFSRYYSSFVQFAYSYVRNQDVAEDISSEAFSSYWEIHKNLSDESNPPAYVLTSIKNTCLNHLKRSTLKTNIKQTLRNHQKWELQTRINSLDACNPYELFSKEIEEIVAAAIEKLPPRTKEIYELSRKHNLSHKEIAAQLNLTTKGVEYHIAQSIKALRSDLKDYLPFACLLFL